MVVQTVMKTPWDSIDEMNTVDNVVMVHKNFAGLFMSCMAFGKFLLPFTKYAESIPTSKQLNPSVQTRMKIDSAPLKYSEISEATYVKIKEFNATTGMPEGMPGRNKLEIIAIDL